MTISACLNKNIDISSLGKIFGSCMLMGRKNLLAYDERKGWEIVQFNSLQLALRALGFYKNTHLSHVHRHFTHIKEKGNANIEMCRKKIQDLWVKKFLMGLGNTNGSNANVICFAEMHDDKLFRRYTADYINEHHQPGDVILVEGIRVEDPVQPIVHPQTQNFQVTCTLQGWEPKNSPALLDPQFQELMVIYEKIKTTIPQNGPLSDTELLFLKQQTEALCVKISNIIKSKQPANPELTEIFHETIRQAETKTLKDPGAVFLAVLLNTLIELSERKKAAFEQNMTSQGLPAIFNAIPLRNESLVREINRYREQGKRVFVIGGMAHFLQFPLPSPGCQEVQDALQKHNYLIITRATDFKKTLAQSNPRLTERPIH